MSNKMAEERESRRGQRRQIQTQDGGKEIINKDDRFVYWGEKEGLRLCIYSGQSFSLSYEKR